MPLPIGRFIDLVDMDMTALTQRDHVRDAIVGVVAVDVVQGDLFWRRSPLVVLRHSSGERPHTRHSPPHASRTAYRKSSSLIGTAPLDWPSVQHCSGASGSLDNGPETRSVETSESLQLGAEVTVRGPVRDGRIEATDVQSVTR